MDNEKQLTPSGEPEAPISAKKMSDTLLDVLEAFVLSAMSVILIFTFFLRITIVDGPSMEDTLHDGEALLVSDFLYTPNAGDIVIIHQPTPHYPDPLVKRIIAVGGQTVDIDFDTWTVTVDGVVIDEPYIKLTDDQRITSNLTYPLVVPEGCVFVMGDNRNHSADSRTSLIGMIDVRCILGKVLLRIAPLPVFGPVD